MIVGVAALITIGEFSSRCGLSPRVLRTYADIGLLVPALVDPSSGYRYYDEAQLDEAEIIAFLRRAGVAVADISRFLSEPAGETVDLWERALVNETLGRRDALVEVRSRLALTTAPTRGRTMIEIRPVRDRIELEQVFNLVGGEFPEPIDISDRDRFEDLTDGFPADQPLMVVATSNGEPIGGAFAFRYPNRWVGLRIMAVVEGFRHRGIGRRLCERIEAEARHLGALGVSLGADDAVGFYCHLGYTPQLLFQWVFAAELYEAESQAIIDGPLHGLQHARSAFNDIPQLFVVLDEPRLDLRHQLRNTLKGCHVGFVMTKELAQSTATA